MGQFLIQPLIRIIWEKTIQEFGNVNTNKLFSLSRRYLKQSFRPAYSPSLTLIAVCIYFEAAPFLLPTRVCRDFHSSRSPDTLFAFFRLCLLQLLRTAEIVLFCVNQTVFGWCFKN